MRDTDNQEWPDVQEQLREVWDSLTSPVYRLLEPTGGLILSMRVRQNGDTWLLRDFVDGYTVLDYELPSNMLRLEEAPK